MQNVIVYKEKEKEDESSKKIEFFSNPKTVIKKTEKNILFLQIIVSGVFCGIMLLLKIFLPQLFENLDLYFTKLFL